MTSIRAVSPSNVYDVHKMKHLLHSAEKQNIHIDIIGLGKPFTFLSKIHLLHEYLESIPCDENPIVCFTDAYDVFYVDSLATIREKFLRKSCSILFSAERWYSHQLKCDKSYYDSLAEHTASPYKYINTGTFMGYKVDLLRLLRDVIASIQKDAFLRDLATEGWTLRSGCIDQTILSHHLAKYWDTYNVKFDYDCSIFYIPCYDWNNLNEYVSQPLVVKQTGMAPSIVHVPWKDKYECILIRLYNRIYNPSFETANPVLYKRYSWQNKDMYFKPDGCVDAFGSGSYVQIDTYTFLVIFGGYAHDVTFNDTYTQYTSVRRPDRDIVKGSLIA